METTEGNKLIARFMELETPDGVYFEYLTKEGYRSEPTHFMLLPFHSSWDWLMPVAEKIKLIGEQEKKYSIEFEIAFGEKGHERLYKAVVEFIQWYNEKK